jgi:hypothetical protein
MKGGREGGIQTFFNPFVEQFFLLLFPLLEEIENVMEFLFDGQIWLSSMFLIRM